MKEIWLNHPEIDDRYEISNLGRIRRYDIDLILKPTLNQDQGILFTLFKTKNFNKRKKYKIHRLVGELFVPNDNVETKTVVKHIDGNRTNNVATNLEWISYQESVQIDYLRGNTIPPKPHTEDFVIQIREEFDESTINIHSLSAKYNISTTTLLDMCRYKTYSNVQPEKKEDYKINYMGHEYEYRKQKILKPIVKSNYELDIDVLKINEILNLYVNTDITKQNLGKKYNLTQKDLNSLLINNELPKIELKDDEVFYEYNSKYRISNYGRFSNLEYTKIIEQKTTDLIAIQLAKFLLSKKITKENKNAQISFIDGNKQNLNVNNLTWNIPISELSTLSEILKQEIISDYVNSTITYNEIMAKYDIKKSTVNNLLAKCPKINICKHCSEKNKESFIKHNKRQQCDKCYETKQYCNLPIEEKEAIIERSKKWVNDNPIRTRILAAKHRAKTKNFGFDIDEEFIIDLYNKQNGKCYYSGLDISIDNLSKGNIFSIDRIDSDLGYLKSNICLTLGEINTMKLDLRLENFLHLIDRIYHHSIKKEA